MLGKHTAAEVEAVLTNPMSFDGRYPEVRPAPANGDDTAAVLSDHLGLTDDEIDALAAAGAVRTKEKDNA